MAKKQRQFEAAEQRPQVIVSWDSRHHENSGERPAWPELHPRLQFLRALRTNARKPAR